MSKNTRLRILIPAIQVLLLIAGAAWHSLAWQRLAEHDIAARYAVAPLDILIKLDFPILVAWLPILYPLNWALSTSDVNLPAGAPSTALGMLFDLAIVSSVALFWYFVVIEAQMRSHGSSLIRSSKGILEVLKAGVLVAAGVGAVAYACWDGHRLLVLGQDNRSLYGSSMADVIIGEPLLVIWAIILIKISVQDLTLAFRKK